MRIRSLFVFALVFLFSIYPPIIAFLQQPAHAPFSYFAGDSFYYLAIADHSGNQPFYTFDRIHPTNGFHPLWQYFVAEAFKAGGISQSTSQLYWVFWVCVVFTALGFSLFALALLNMTQNMALSVLGAVPGPFYLVSGFLNPQYGAPWSFMNGMESCLSVLLFGAVLFLSSRKSYSIRLKTRQMLLMSVLFTVMVLSRLDDVFIFLPFLYYLWITAAHRQAWSRLLMACVAPVLLIGGYLSYNYLSTGLIMPVSGAAKAGWPTIINFYYMLNVFVPFNASVWPETSWRVMQLFLPPAAALLWLIKKRSLDGSKSEFNFNSIFCGYVLLKAGYNIFFVDLWAQGHWYFPVSIMICNLVVVLFLAPFVNRFRLSAALAVFITAMLTANHFIDVKRNFRPPSFDFWLNRDNITQSIRRVYNGAGIVEISDGIFSYATSIPTMSGLGLALDRAAYDAKKRGEFLSIAHDRGFRALAAMNHYLQIDENRYYDQDALRKIMCHAFFLTRENMAEWNFHVILDDRNTGVTVVEFGH
jgi:hypothetical protein